MTGSKQSHTRYTISEKLNQLVGDEITLEDWNQEYVIDKGVLVRRNDKDPGFYINGEKIPIRSIDGITPIDFDSHIIHIIPNYLAKPNHINYDVGTLK